jgi:hypothetical protein
MIMILKGKLFDVQMYKYADVQMTNGLYSKVKSNNI